MGTVHASFEPRRGEDTGRLTLPSKANPHPDGRHFESQPTGASDARTAVPRPPLRLYQALLRTVVAGHFSPYPVGPDSASPVAPSSSGMGIIRYVLGRLARLALDNRGDGDGATSAC
jgi:hypothetical protein